MEKEIKVYKRLSDNQQFGYNLKTWKKAHEINLTYYILIS
jgi:hypothetical protein